MRTKFYVIRFQDTGGRAQYLTTTDDGSPRITNNVLLATRFSSLVAAREQGTLDDYWNAGLPVKKATIILIGLEVVQMKKNKL